MKVRPLKPNTGPAFPPALDIVGDGVIGVDAHDQVTYINAAACDLLCLDRSQALRKPLDSILELEPDRARQGISFAPAHADRKLFHSAAEAMVLVSPCRRRAVEVVDINDRNSGTDTHHWVVIHDCSKEIELRRSIAEQAQIDKLTGLLNRHEMDRCLANLIEDAEATQQTHALLYIDLDQFKVVNDTCGHQAGDELLRMLGLRLKNAVQQGDIVGRLGGDEFAVLLCQVDAAEAQEVAQRICVAIAGIRFAWGSHTFAVGASIGVTMITEHTRTSSIAMRQVDAACYEAKEQGRNRVHMYEETDRQLAKRRGEMLWLSRINQALSEDQLRIVSQRIVPIQSHGRREMAELLLRVTLPDGRNVLPGTFIPAAERYNLMPTLDRWVIRNAFKLIARIDADKDPIERYTINLSGLSIGDSEFLNYIVNQIEHSGVSPRRICFELTETAAVTSFSRAVRFMSLLREVGCEFALDDFGSGMSSFSYLRELPVDYLKIDGSFITNLAVDPFNRAIVRSITEVNRAAGKQTIAEHVDSEQTMDLLREYGVDFVQGFFIAEPTDMEAFSIAS